MTLVKRLVKGSALTASEHDGNMDHVLEMDNMNEGTDTKILTAAERSAIAAAQAELAEGPFVDGDKDKLDSALQPADIGDTVAAQSDVDAKRPLAQNINANLTSSTTLTSAHIGRLIPATGSGITLDFNVAGVTAGESWDIVNIGTDDVTISNGTSGINRAGNDSFTLPPDMLVRVTYRQSGDPQLLAEFVENLALKVGISCSAAAPASETLAATGSVTFFGPDYDCTLNNVRLVTVGDTASVQIYEAGGAINGFGSPVAASTTAANTASTEAIAANAVLRMDWSSGGASLTGVAAVLYGTRTGN